MKILAVEASAVAASSALIEDGKLIAENFINIKQTHSETLLPMVQELLDRCRWSVKDLDYIALTAGPGSFTGLRIAMAAVKGLSMPYDIPCVPVSTLEAIAYAALTFRGTVIAAMDARCDQVYTAAFDADGKNIQRLTDDSAMSINDLGIYIKDQINPVMLIGDGASLCYNRLNKQVSGLTLAPAGIMYQRAASAGLIAYEKALKGEYVCAEDLAPTYLRLPQAERELLAKQKIK